MIVMERASGHPKTPNCMFKKKKKRKELCIYDFVHKEVAKIGFQEDINKVFEEKKTELHPKVIEIYEASSEEIKVCVCFIFGGPLN